MGVWREEFVILSDVDGQSHETTLKSRHEIMMPALSITLAPYPLLELETNSTL
jgi:hypothetical protein